MPTIAKTPPALGWFAVLVECTTAALNFADAKLLWARKAGLLLVRWPLRKGRGYAGPWQPCDGRAGRNSPDGRERLTGAVRGLLAWIWSIVASYTSS